MNKEDARVKAIEEKYPGLLGDVDIFYEDSNSAHGNIIDVIENIEEILSRQPKHYRQLEKL